MTRFDYIKTEDGFYQCPHCNEKKRLMSTMHMHYRAYHDGTFKHKCKHCNFETATKQTLDNHILAKHPNQCKEKRKEFACPTCNCDYKGNTKAALRSHFLLRHLTEEVSKLLGMTENNELCCTGCGSLFKSKPAFNYHVVKCLSQECLKREDVRKALGISAEAVPQ